MRRQHLSSRLALAILLAPSILLSQVNIRQALLAQKLDVQENVRVDLRLQPLAESRKSVVLAVVYSVLLPGMGDLYADHFQAGKYYVMADAGLWLTYAGFRVEAGWLKQDAQSFALQHSAASLAEKDAQYAVNVGNYSSVDAYNQAKLRNGEYDKLYDPRSSYAWSWDSDASRLAFKSRRTRSDEVLRNSEFVLGGLVLNRIVAALSAWRATALFNERVAAGSKVKMGLRVTGGLTGPPGIQLTLQKTF
jgi:hypothetical protein